MIEKGKEISVKEEGIVGEVRKGVEKWRIIGVYVSKRLDVAKSLEKWTGKEGEELVLLGGGL